MTHADWGCGDGTHRGWLVAEADTRELAMLMVPPELRQDATIFEISRFTREQIATLISELER
jgi:hypothetical protein